MVVSVFVSTDGVEEKAQVVFHAREISVVTGLLEVKARRGIFDQRAIEVVFSVFGSS